jgi:hypothetical protein
MVSTYFSERSKGSGQRQADQRLGVKMFGALAGKYRSLRQRLADLLHRGDRDYGRLSALSQEIGRIRQSIRLELERRRIERKARKDRRRSDRKPRVTP